MKPTDKQIEECLLIGKQMLDNGNTIDDILIVFRQRTTGKAASILLIYKLLEISAREAKLLVHNSPVWADHKASDEKTEENLIKALDSLAIKKNAD